MWSNPQETADLVTFTEEIFNRKLHFLCSDYQKEKNTKRIGLMKDKLGGKIRTTFVELKANTCS